MIDKLILLLFILVFLAVTIDLLGLIITKYSKYRTWPPTKGTWIWRIELLLTWIWTPGFFIVCLLTIGTFIFTNLFFTIVGATIFVLGLYLDIQGIRHLQSGYVKLGDLTTTGIYSVTRNPQYVGSLFMGIGAVLSLNSFYGFLIAFPAATWFIIAPYVEEEFLLKHYDNKYRKYCAKVPRFFF